MHANLAYFHFAKQLLSLISVEAEKNLNGKIAPRTSMILLRF